MGILVFGKDASAFVAALVVGVVGGIAGSLLRRSSLVFVVPGVLMLVPGSAGFTSALQLLANQTVSGITAGFDTFVTAMSIAYGLMIASVLLPRRFASSSRLANRRRDRLMCRWLAYSGSRSCSRSCSTSRDHSLIDQSLHSRLGVETTNGDGFGVGWYDDGPHAAAVPRHRPRMERPQPARDRRPRPLPAVLRAHPGLDRHRGAADQLPPVPPRPLAVDAQRADRRASTRVKRELMLAVDPSLYPSIEGTTDSEVMFYLALTFGLEDDPAAAVARMVGLRGGAGRAARRRAPDADDGRHHRRDDASGCSATPARATRARCSTAPRMDALQRAATPRSPSSQAVSDETRLDRLRAAGRPARRLERGARVPRGDRPVGGRRAAPVLALTACLTAERRLGAWARARRRPGNMP